MTISVIVDHSRQGWFSERPAVDSLELKKREGIEGRLLDLRDFPMPFFDQCRGARPTNTRWLRNGRLKSQPRMVLYSSRLNTTTALRGAEKADLIGSIRRETVKAAAFVS